MRMENGNWGRGGGLGVKCEVERENEMEEKLASNQANGRTRDFTDTKRNIYRR